MADGIDLPYNDTNPSGIGNTVLHQDVNMLDEQRQNNAGNTAAVDQFVKQRQQAKKDNETFLAGLQPNIAGIMPEDTPYFQKKGQELLDLAAKGVAAGGDIKNPSNPYYWKIQSAINNMNSEIEMSKGQKQNLLKVSTPYLMQPDKYESGATTA